jgi:hypothetical protein
MDKKDPFRYQKSYEQRQRDKGLKSVRRWEPDDPEYTKRISRYVAGCRKEFLRNKGEL